MTVHVMDIAIVTILQPGVLRWYGLIGTSVVRAREWNPKMTATAGSDVVQSGRPIFDDFSNICGRISAITQRMLSSKWSSVYGLSA
ncbi:hypothetical protein TNCV_4210521 [Trichonephila clavipes]|nr:hypothetical protein TNCV_4210521 [Trichonephila clavipes]